MLTGLFILLSIIYFYQRRIIIDTIPRELLDKMENPGLAVK
jgi:hypothetical protein